MPAPPPEPLELVTLAARGSPILGILLFGILRSGGPSSEGSIGSLGFGFLITAVGGVNCVIANFGARPLLAGTGLCSPPPPPPPAGFVPGGSFGAYGEISRGVRSREFLFTALIGLTPMRNGTN